MSAQMRAESELLIQRETIARFGELALRSNDLDEILLEACTLIGKAMGTDLAKVMELRDQDTMLFVRAGVGWKPGVVGQETLKVEKTSSEGYALSTGQPVFSTDVARETRFTYAKFILDNGVQALVNVPIPKPNGHHYGILQVDSRQPRDFNNHDVGFVRGYANLLGAAVDRILQAEALQRSAAALAESEAVLHQTQKLEAIGQLTGGVAHDFNNLLTIIRSSIDFLQRPSLPEAKRVRYMEAISETVDRATVLTSHLLAFARRQPLKPQVFDVGAQISTTLDLLRPSLGSRIRIEKSLCDPPCFAEADVNQFETALINLAINARDAMNGEGSIYIEAREVADLPDIRGHKSAPGSYIAVSVQDTGPGIDPSAINLIFEPFFTTKGVGSGTGLGLSQALGFAKQSGGQLDVQGHFGHGALLTLYLPQRPTPAPADATPPEPEPVHFKGACVLLVEDNEAVGRFAEEMLGDLGYKATWVLDASVALSLLAQDENRFDVVFSDVVMPGMSGIDFAQVARDRWPTLPVVLASGYSHILADEGPRGFELGQKPYSIDTLSRALQRATTRSK